MRISDWRSDVCSSDLSEWDEENQIWVHDDGELNAILHIGAAQKPQNEAQAALAAQTAATHILTMKVAKRVADYPHDTRMIAAYAKLARASATQFETMAVLKGKRRSDRKSTRLNPVTNAHLVCRLLLEKKKKINKAKQTTN